MKRHAPAADRNRQPILAVLAPLLCDGALVLEVASGSGQHAAFFARSLPAVTFQPSDADPEALASIGAYVAEEALPNLRPPLSLDASSDAWSLARADAIVCINMIHIAPWSACEGLVRGAARLLDAGGVLFLYGPYRIDGGFEAPSNHAFDASLRARDPAWGVRDLEAVTALAEAHGFAREAVVPMPANNHSLVFRKSGSLR